jgi:hypothetical protein
MRSVLVCGFSLNDRACGFMALCSSQPRPDGWDANLHLLLKLVGASFATGLERLRVQRHLARLEERNDALAAGANDGCGISTSRTTRSGSRRAGARCSVTTSTIRTFRPTGGDWCIRDDMARVQAADPRPHRGQDADVRERASHAPHQGRVALGREPRQGARRRPAGCGGWWASNSTSPSASCTRTRCSRRRRARRSRCSRSATA